MSIDVNIKLAPEDDFGFRGVLYDADSGKKIEETTIYFLGPDATKAARNIAKAHGWNVRSYR